jgi:predicted nuclease of predicted toxin-antitoxin system
MLAASPPPWIVHLRVGNVRLRLLKHHVATVWPSVESLLPKAKLISVFIDRIEAVE